ncbi:MAG: universal stress protein [Nevskiaceae bacterium]|jgi:universal stress protein E|nr:universal stress protein [Nevskiaceae bacterium]
MDRIKQIVVAIKTPSSRRQPPMQKAAQLAKATGARLLLFHAITQPLMIDAWSMDGVSLQDVQKRWKASVMKQLEKLADGLRTDGVTVECNCTWDFPAYEAVVRFAEKNKADLIVAERTESKRLMPWLLRFNDWELIRRSAIPVLLVKRTTPWKKAAVLAAIDPLHTFAKPAKLDTAILDEATWLAEAMGGALHVVHAYPGAPTSMPLRGVSADLSQSIEKQAATSARKALDAELEGRNIPKARRHLVAGHPVDVVPKTAKKVRAGIVAMGAVSRSGIKRLVIGNTAEQVLDALPCDVLVLKPSTFKARVPEKTRGTQLVAPPPYI